MRQLGVFTILLFLVFGGMMVGSACVVENLIPPWLFLLFLLPAAILLDYFFSAGTYAWQITKYSTTIALLSLTVLGLLLTKFEGFRSFFLMALAVVCLIPLFFAPEILLYLLGSVIGGIDDYRQKKKS